MLKHKKWEEKASWQGTKPEQRRQLIQSHVRSTADSPACPEHHEPSAPSTLPGWGGKHPTVLETSSACTCQCQESPSNPDEGSVYIKYPSSEGVQGASPCAQEVSLGNASLLQLLSPGGRKMEPAGAWHGNGESRSIS